MPFSFLEKSDRELGVLKSLGRRLFTRPGRMLDGHFEQRGIFSCYIRHRVVSPTRILILLTLIGTAFVGSKMIPETSVEKPVSRKTSPVVPDDVSVNREIREIPSLSGDAAPETDISIITLRQGDTLWRHVSDYLVANNLPCTDKDVQRVVENFLADYPDIDETRIPAWSEFQITHTNGVVSLTPVKR